MISYHFIEYGNLTEHRLRTRSVPFLDVVAIKHDTMPLIEKVTSLNAHGIQNSQIELLDCTEHHKHRFAFSQSNYSVILDTNSPNNSNNIISQSTVQRGVHQPNPNLIYHSLAPLPMPCSRSSKKNTVKSSSPVGA
jgi:hypothetical protein